MMSGMGGSMREAVARAKVAHRAGYASLRPRNPLRHERRNGSSSRYSRVQASCQFVPVPGA